MNPYNIANKNITTHTMILNISLIETPRRHAEVIVVEKPSKKARTSIALRVEGQSNDIISNFYNKLFLKIKSDSHFYK